MTTSDLDQLAETLRAGVLPPPEAMNALRFLEADELARLVALVHGMLIPPIGAGERAGRGYLGHHYQILWRQRHGKETNGIWSARAVAAIRCLRERVSDRDYDDRFAALVQLSLSNDGGAQDMFTLDPTESEVIADLTERTDVPDAKPGAIVRKPRPLRAVPPVGQFDLGVTPPPSAIKRKGENRPVADAKAPKAIKVAKKKVTAKPKAKAAKTTKPKAERKAGKPRAEVTRSPEVEAKNALAAKFKIGESYTYTGRDKDLTGKKVEVVEYLRGDGRLRVKRGSGDAEVRITCSPYALGAEKPAGKAFTPKKAAKKK